MTELSETQIQNKVLRWAKRYPYKGKVLADYLVHVPNGEKRSKRVAAGLKHSGVKKGYPDLVMDIALNGYHGLRIELKTIRMKNNMTLLGMSSAMNMTPAQLSNYEHNIGALSNPVHATAIDRWCVETHNLLSDSAIILSYKPVITDISKSLAMVERWRNGDFSQECSGE